MTALSPDERDALVARSTRRRPQYTGTLALLAHRIRPRWMRDALCREYPDVSFILEARETAGPARAICARCLVRTECLEYALARPDLEGVWAGTTTRERSRLRGQHQKP